MKHFFYIYCILLCTLCSCSKSNTIIVDYTDQISENDLIKITNECPYKCQLKDKTIKIYLPNNIKEFNGDLLRILGENKDPMSRLNIIKNIILPNSITEIKRYTFCNIKSLQSITLPKNISIIDTRTFRECENLKFITTVH